MSESLESRLDKILPGGRGVWIPLDHGISQYPEEGLENMDETIGQLIDSQVDAIIIHKGVLSYQNKIRDWSNFVCHVSASTVHGGNRSGEKVSIATAEECLDRGAIGVSGQINMGEDNEAEMIIEMGDLTTDAWALEIPVLGMIYPRGENLNISEDDETNGVAHAARLAWEIGCDIVKVPWTGSVESFQKVTRSVPIPVLIAGGSKDISFNELLRNVEQSIQAGGSGVCIGRQVFSSKNIGSSVKALRAIVHEGMSAIEAIKLLEE